MTACSDGSESLSVNYTHTLKIPFFSYLQFYFNSTKQESYCKVGLLPIPFLPGRPVFWPLCPMSHHNPGQDVL